MFQSYYYYSYYWANKFQSFVIININRLINNLKKLTIIVFQSYYYY